MATSASFARKPHGAKKAASSAREVKPSLSCALAVRLVTAEGDTPRMYPISFVDRPRPTNSRAHRPASVAASKSGLTGLSTQLTTAQEQAEKLEGLAVQIAQKAGVDGKLFGSVTNADIAEALKEKGFDIQKSAIRMPQGPLKNVGEHSLKVALHTDVVVTINVSVIAEQ